MEARCYRTDAFRSQPEQFLASVDARFAGAIIADITSLAKHGDSAPISIRSIRGFTPLWEIRTDEDTRPRGNATRV